MVNPLEENEDVRPLRVLTFDGGGMRGVYTAAYLHALLHHFAKERDVESLDLGAGFDLIVGTSTGAILACAAAIGVPMSKVVDLYSKHGSKIFPQRLRSDIRILPQFFTRPRYLKRGADALQSALVDVLGDETFGTLYQRRNIALAIPAVEMSQERSWVYKTRHCGGVRDENTKLVDACMASSAAPIFRSLAAVQSQDGMDGQQVFADGGLWANNPALVGLLDALLMDNRRPIQLFSVGNLPRPNGEHIPESKLHRGLWGWKFGGKAAELSIAAQEFAFDHMARMFGQVVSNMGRPVSVVRLPTGAPIPSLMKHLDIDNASNEAVSALIGQARADANLSKSICSDPQNAVGQLIRAVFSNLPSETRGANV